MLGAKNILVMERSHMLTQCFPYNILLFLGLEEVNGIVFLARRRQEWVGRWRSGTLRFEVEPLSGSARLSCRISGKSASEHVT